MIFAEPKREPREKRPRPERKNDYDFNADLIDENTVIPPLPKKNELIPKPDIATFKARETKNSARIEEIIEKKVPPSPRRKPFALRSSSSTVGGRSARPATNTLNSRARSARCNSCGKN
jgi:hypothetical protein